MRSINITLARRFVHRSRCLWWHAVLLACIAPFILPASYAGDLVINEFMADNATTVSDPEGDEDDWIELYNSGSTDIDVAGMYLTDNLGNPTQHLIDTNSLIIGPGDHLLFWADNDTVDGPMHLNFKLRASGEQIGLYGTDGNTLIDSVTFGQQAPDISYGRYPDGSDTWRSMGDATPGDTNSIGQAGDVEFSIPSRTFTNSLTVELSATNDADEIRYTIDGTIPTGASDVYSSGISFTNSTRLRARAYKSGMEPGAVFSEAYILLSSNAWGFTSEIPVLVFDTFNGGALPSETFQFAHWSIFEPTNSVTRLTNAMDLATRAGIRTRGSSSSVWPKKSLNIESWIETDDDGKNVKPMGLPSESDWVLVAPYAWERTMIRNPVGYEISNQMGQYAARHRLVEVFVNTNGGALSYPDDYQGVYMFAEKLKRDRNRIDVEALSPTDNAAPEVTGGYILKIDRPDPGDSGFQTSRGHAKPYFGGSSYCFVEPSEDELTAQQRGFITDYFEDLEDALFAADFTNKVTGYPKYLDVDAAVDHHWLAVLTKCVDGLALSAYMYKKREDDKLIMGPFWDLDRSSGVDHIGEDRPRYPVNWQCKGPGDLYFTYHYWGRFFEDPDFWQSTIDRWQELRGTVLATTNVQNIIGVMSNQIAQAVLRNNSKWPEMSGRTGGGLSGEFDGTWDGEIRHLDWWYTTRLAWIDDQFVDLPEFSQDGGQVTAPFDLTITVPAGATVYYTLDGTDPRAPGGGIAGTEYTGSPISLTSNVIVRARAHDSNNFTTPYTNTFWIPWSAPREAVFMVAPHTVAVTEVMYNPRAPEPGTAETNYVTSDFEFIEISNTGNVRVDLAGLSFSDGILFDWSYGSVPSLEIGESAIVVNNLAAFTNRYPDWGTIKIAGEYEGSLNDGGESIRLESVTGQAVSVFSYNDSRAWPLTADGVGHSLVATELDHQAAESLSYGGNWRASTYMDGSPGVANPAPIVDVVINEFAAHTDTLDPAPLDSDDWIELYNTGPGNVTLTNWYLSDDADALKKWAIPASNVIDTATWLTFTERTGFNTEGTNGFGLNKAGEQIFLSYLPGTDQDRVADYVSFDGQENGASWGRYPDGAEFWYAMTLTPTASNQLAALEPVISEIMYRPAAVGTNAADNSDHEYVVIQNDTGADVDLWNAVGPWRINGIGYTLPSNTVIGAGAALTIVAFDPTDTVAVSNFLAAHNLSGTHTNLLGPHDGKLSNTGERLALERPQAADLPDPNISWVTVDEVIYSASVPWPDASTNGAAIHRINLRHSGNDPLNWTAQPPALARPKVVLTSPRNGSHMLIPFSHTATAVLNTNMLVGTLQYVEFFLNGASIGTDTSDPFEAVIDHTRMATAGTYTVYARVVDDEPTNSVASVFTAELAPRVAITSPPDGASFLLPFSTTLEASVDAEHVVGDATVTFFNGTTSLGVSATNGPYEIAVNYTNFPAPGTYPLYAVLDDDFASTTSLVSVLTVATADLEISGIALDEGQFSLSWNAASGAWYTVWWTDDLMSGWPSGQVFTTSSGFWIDPESASVTQRFYRITTAPAP